MRILVAPQEFKGSLTAAEAARAIAGGVRAALPAAEVVEAPLSDGGPGLVDVLLSAVGGERVGASCRDPLMRPVEAIFGVLPGGAAVIEMAAASGLVLLSADELDPLRATTYGTGELILAAIDAGCRELIIGVGGSATVDGGAGAAQALGVRLLDARGADLAPGGGALRELARVDATALDPRLRAVRLRIAVDVRNPLCGPTGAARMFGPQKGATAEGIEILEAGLTQLAAVLAAETGRDVRALPGAGAAGGLPAVLVALTGATIEPGFELVAELTDLLGKVDAADVVITGEGRLDAQTAYGKTVAGVAALAREHGKPVGVVAGSAEDGAADLFDAVELLSDVRGGPGAAMRDAARLAGEAGMRIARRLVAR